GAGAGAGRRLLLQHAAVAPSAREQVLAAALLRLAAPLTLQERVVLLVALRGHCRPRARLGPRLPVLLQQVLVVVHEELLGRGLVLKVAVVVAGRNDVDLLAVLDDHAAEGGQVDAVARLLACGGLNVPGARGGGSLTRPPPRRSHRGRAHRRRPVALSARVSGDGTARGTPLATVGGPLPAERLRGGGLGGDGGRCPGRGLTAAAHAAPVLPQLDELDLLAARHAAHVELALAFGRALHRVLLSAQLEVAGAAHLGGQAPGSAASCRPRAGTPFSRRPTWRAAAPAWSAWPGPG
ncbi:Spatacsin, partial [Frankliniella fusca]